MPLCHSGGVKVRSYIRPLAPLVPCSTIYAAVIASERDASYYWSSPHVVKGRKSRGGATNEKKKKIPSQLKNFWLPQVREFLLGDEADSQILRKALRQLGKDLTCASFQIFAHRSLATLG